MLNTQEEEAKSSGKAQLQQMVMLQSQALAAILRQTAFLQRNKVYPTRAQPIVDQGIVSNATRKDTGPAAAQTLVSPASHALSAGTLGTGSQNGPVWAPPLSQAMEI